MSFVTVSASTRGWLGGGTGRLTVDRTRQRTGARQRRVLRDLAGGVGALDYYASSLHRTCSTMELLRGEIGLPPTGYRADARLMEGNLGDHARVSTGDFLSHPDHLADPWNYVRPNGESQAMVYERVGRFLCTVSRDSVIVTHALPVVMIRAHYLGLSPQQAMGYHMGNAGVLRLSTGTETLFGH